MYDFQQTYILPHAENVHLLFTPCYFKEGQLDKLTFNDIN